MAPPTDDYERFVIGVRDLTGIDLDQYRRPQMERRLRTFARRQQCADLDAYLAHLVSDPDGVGEFRDRMTINVSELFRNPEHFRQLEERHLPDLLGRAGGDVSVWSAGCSYGAELYSVAMLLAEQAPAGRHRLLGTDIDPLILERARGGRFREADLRAVSEARRRQWFMPVDTEDGRRWQIDPALREAVRFRRHDLLADTYPQGVDVICCRNVVIYFTDAAKEEIYRKFFAALRPGGILFIGATERIAEAEAIGFEHAGMFFHRRPG